MFAVQAPDLATPTPVRASSPRSSPGEERVALPAPVGSRAPASPPPVPDDPFAAGSAAQADDPFAAAGLSSRAASPVPPSPPSSDDPFLAVAASDPFAGAPDLALALGAPSARRPPQRSPGGDDHGDVPVPGVERSLAADVERPTSAASRYDGMDVSALGLDPAAAPARGSDGEPGGATPAARPNLAAARVTPRPEGDRRDPGARAADREADEVSSRGDDRPPGTPARRARGGAVPRPEPSAIAPPLPPPRVGARRSAAMNALSLAGLLGLAVALFLAGRGRIAHAGPTEPASLSVSGVTGGLYDTAGGPPVLVVRGRLTARAEVTGPVRVSVDLVDGGGVVASAAGVAGGVATPEEVHAAATPADVERLRDRLQLRAAARLAAGESAPFVVVFPAPAPDPLRVEVRVTPRAD